GHSRSPKELASRSSNREALRNASGSGAPTSGFPPAPCASWLGSNSPSPRASVASAFELDLDAGLAHSAGRPPHRNDLHGRVGQASDVPAVGAQEVRVLHRV